MICSPTNAYPNNNCVDGNDYELKITFFGDYSVGADFFIYDYNTKEKIGNVLYYDRGKTTNGFYNGEEIDIKNTPPLVQNNEYVWRAKFYERVDTSTGFYPSIYSTKGEVQKDVLTAFNVAENVHDVKTETFICVPSDLKVDFPCYIYWEGHGRRKVINYSETRGLIKIDEAYDTAPPQGTTMYLSKTKFSSLGHLTNEEYYITIDKGLNIDTGKHKQIKSVDENGNITWENVGNSYLRVVEPDGLINYVEIKSYYPTTGVLGLYEDMSTIASVGTPYQIYQSFVISPYYYFTTKAIPVVTPYASFVNGVIKCNATIDTAGNYPVKYYYWSIYNGDGELVDQSQKIYSGRLEYLFREAVSHTSYSACITVVTQDGVEVTSSPVGVILSHKDGGISNLTASVNDNNNSVLLSWINDTVPPTNYMILREDGNGYIKYLETINKTIDSYTDYSCGDISDYTYYVVPRQVEYVSDTDDGGGEVVDPVVEDYDDLVVMINTFNNEQLYYDTKENELAALEAKGADRSQTSYGNVNANAPRGISWTSDNLNKYKAVLKNSWAMTDSDINNIRSRYTNALAQHTVITLGDGTEMNIVFSPIRYDDRDAEFAEAPIIKLIDDTTVSKYLLKLENELKQSGTLTEAGLRAADSVGYDIDGTYIIDIFGGAYETAEIAEAVAKSIDYIGDYGYIAKSNERLDNYYEKILALTQKDTTLLQWYNGLDSNTVADRRVFVRELSDTLENDMGVEGIIYPSNFTSSFMPIYGATSSNDLIYSQAEADVSTYFSDWAIYFLDEVPYERPDTSITDVRIYHEYMWGDKQFKVNSMWKVQLEPKIDDITHNIYRELSEPKRGKPVITYGNKDYDSFHLEFMLGNISCPDERMTGYDQRTFEKWKADVNSKRPVMIKDSKGNVWFGAITAHEYLPGYNENEWQLYTIKIDFSQTRDMNKTRILTD